MGFWIFGDSDAYYLDLHEAWVFSTTVTMDAGIESTYSTSYSSLMFYTSSVVSRADLYAKGFVDNLKFPDYATPYCITKTTTWENKKVYGDDASDMESHATLSTSVVNTFYYDILNLPSSSVGVMMLYDGDVSETSDYERALEYNVAESDVSETWTNYDSIDIVHDYIDDNGDFWKDSTGRSATVSWNVDNLEPWRGQASYAESEKGYLTELFGTTAESMHISASAAEIFHDFVTDIYNAAPVSRTAFAVTPNIGLHNYNLQPLQQAESGGGTVGGNYTSREESDTA